jgi:hypothetical protein
MSEAPHFPAGVDTNRPRVVYVDNDPMVELHSRALLDSGGTISVICADLRDPARSALCQ